MRKNKKKILLLCLTFILIIGASAFISATTVIENEVFIKFEDQNLYNLVKDFFSGKENNFKHNANEETLTIRNFAR